MGNPCFGARSDGLKASSNARLKRRYRPFPGTSRTFGGIASGPATCRVLCLLFSMRIVACVCDVLSHEDAYFPGGPPSPPPPHSPAAPELCLILGCLCVFLPVCVPYLPFWLTFDLPSLCVLTEVVLGFTSSLRYAWGGGEGVICSVKSVHPAYSGASPTTHELRRLGCRRRADVARREGESAPSPTGSYPVAGI